MQDSHNLEPPDDPMRILKPRDGMRMRKCGALEPPDDPMRILKHPGSGCGSGRCRLEPPDDPMRILKHGITAVAGAYAGA